MESEDTFGVQLAKTAAVMAVVTAVCYAPLAVVAGGSAILRRRADRKAREARKAAAAE